MITVSDELFGGHGSPSTLLIYLRWRRTFSSLFRCSESKRHGFRRTPDELCK